MSDLRPTELCVVVVYCSGVSGYVCGVVCGVVWAFMSPLLRIFESKIRLRSASIKTPCDHLEETKR